MIRLSLILWLAVIAGTVQAATVTVRSGEHEDFTRLVAFLPKGAEWTVDSADRVIRLQLASAEEHRFDHRTVFDRIPKTRIASLSAPGSNRLEIALNCACQVTTLFEAPRLLIIDVGDSADPATPAVPEPAPQQARPAAPEALQTSLRAPLVTRQAYSTSSVSHFAEALAGQTTRQILDVGDPDAPRPDGDETLGRDLRNIDLPNIALPKGAGETPARRQRRAACSGPVAAPLGTFGGEVDFFAEKGALSAALYTERLALDPQAAIALAQLHLSQGLGTEARQILAMVDRLDPGRAFLAQLSMLIEDPESVPRSSFEPYRDCSEVNAIWPVLAAPRPPMSEGDGWQVARAAEALPRPLLRAIGPRVITNLVDSGQKDPANMIARILERLGPPGQTMADVRLAEAASDKEEILTEIARSNGEDAAEASALLVERTIDAGAPVPDELAALVASHAEEQRHGEAGSMLRKAEAFSLISQENFDAALPVLTQGSLDPEAQASVTAQFFRHLAESADTVTFLRIALARPALAEAAPPEVRQAVAARLYENRFPEAAARLIETSEPLDDALLAEALGARLHGAVGIPDAVLFKQTDSEDRATGEARYAALLGAGRFAEAKQTALRLGKPDPVDPLLSLEPAQDPPRGETPLTLEGAGALTEATAALAETVTAVLADPLLRLEP